MFLDELEQIDRAMHSPPCSFGTLPRPATS